MRVFFVFLSFIALPGLVSAQNQGAKFTFDKGDTYDFGILKRGPIAIDTFWFQNTGNDVLNITNVTPSCGCTKVAWTRQPIAPNERGYISLGLKTEEQHGAFSKEVYIESNVVNNPGGEKRYTLHIKGEARDEVPGKK